MLVFDHQPYVQYWSTGAGIGDGIGWNVTEFTLTDDGLSASCGLRRWIGAGETTFFGIGLSAKQVTNICD